MIENLDEQLLEQLYWEFDTQRKTKAERDVFKRKIRFFANNSIRKVNYSKNVINSVANIMSTGKNMCQCERCSGSIYKPYSYSWDSYKFCPHCGVSIVIKHNGKII